MSDAGMLSKHRFHISNVALIAQNSFHLMRTLKPVDLLSKAGKSFPGKCFKLLPAVKIFLSFWHLRYLKTGWIFLFQKIQILLP